MIGATVSITVAMVRARLRIKSGIHDPRLTAQALDHLLEHVIEFEAQHTFIAVTLQCQWHMSVTKVIGNSGDQIPVGRTYFAKLLDCCLHDEFITMGRATQTILVAQYDASRQVQRHRTACHRPRRDEATGASFLSMLEV
jgi:hypothetical protein